MSKDKDHLASALDAMMNGQADESSHDEIVETPAPPPPAAAPAPAPRTARPSAPVLKNRPSPVPAPAAPQPAPAGRPARPAKPAAAAQSAAPVDYAARKPVRKKPVPYFASLDFKQTIIPPCLCVGLGFLVLTVLFFLQPATSALRMGGVLLPAGMAVVGLILLAVGVANVLIVKRELAKPPAN